MKDAVRDKATTGEVVENREAGVQMQKQHAEPKSMRQKQWPAARIWSITAAKSWAKQSQGIPAAPPKGSLGAGDQLQLDCLGPTDWAQNTAGILEQEK